MLAVVYVVLFIASSVGGMVGWHASVHGVFSPLQASLSLFCTVNILINIWELALLFHIKLIQSQSVGFFKKLPRGELPRPLFLFDSMPLRDALSLRGWAQVWSTYSLVDISYADTHSFGWMIDVGNGISSLPPSILWVVCQTKNELLPAKVVAMIGIASFWQQMYGTILYFAQYVYNRRWEKHGNSTSQIFALVLCSNALWLVGPGLGLAVCVRMILSETEGEAWRLFM